MPRPPVPEGPPAGAAEARALYEAGVPIREIAAQTGLSTSTVYYWADRQIAADGTVTLRPQRRRRASRSKAPPAPRRRRDLVNRLWRAAERQVHEIESRLAGLSPESGPAEAERDARALAVLARVLRELATLEAREAEMKLPDEEGAPQDADTFRRELTRRLEALRAASA